MTAAERWLAAVWPIVRDRLPAPPARILELGCGPLGGFVPELRSSGYEVVGVDPEAPDEDDYRRIAFEQADLQAGFDAAVASTSLHHVAGPVEVIAQLARLLADQGTLVVVEWAWEDFDEPTARWCFDRLGPEQEAGWLHHRRDDWADSGQEWSSYLRGWAERERLHSAASLLRLLDQRFDRQHLARRAYFFPDLGQTSEQDELAAVASAQIRATRVDYVGHLR